MTVGTDELLSRVPTKLLINGEWVDGSAGETFDVQNPATGEIIATLSSGTERDAIKALDAACNAQEAWSATTPRERAEILRRAFDLVTEKREELATLMTLEMGKPLAEARGEVTYGAEYLRWFSEETVRHYGRSFEAPEGTLRMITRRKPVGPCLLITPWNFPLAMATRKVAPAIAAGCTMVLKPAALTPLTSQYFAQLLIEAGLPKGVLNVVSSNSASSISRPILSDPRTRKVSFTGSTPVGRLLLKQAADNVLRVSMELGGNAPFIVFNDADIDQAVEGAMAAKMRNIGEACTAANRILVQEDISALFIQKLASKFETLKIGNGLDDEVTCGPLIDQKAVDSMQALVQDALDKGATAVVGGSKVDGPGFFFEPTLLTGVTSEMRVAQEEIFGPIAPIITFTDEAEAIRIANDTEYGLASYIFTEDSDRLWRVADALEFGLVGFNAGVISNAAAPFGGVKQSGMGREGGAEALDEYTSLQYIGVRNPYGS
ncbi:NAD-dependent succinate-semialdehyde dehydrogenase [Corynebacterium sp. 153RC1]|uniref:NAD-dependent succinate-semialdehyde dehydrogenase n=1 Tax=unclassified Corynebacterium TaxID=2624378 RepID=UPI00211CE857|nr:MULTISPECIES: NAD-dependent succinate-semialdehyde dehydrogenase [unclassified Corynebacterium]MCQ9353433.1 NAD-dependent succinate-semialdehyde dehydrogenase [Corynebacterium sp. 209RC1]MCQ9355655.1 NAD-dependent succinate-semialdehyde dehydrogenase [Corynebacterium sp. 1222RC1]MCQ9357848.1 NAD-dependent succinate-semialdehyde dehydrogenase [Corynebacterium sp. 122RC1]MCQ9360032.1 NAD-dependent succinate-semialdehyde dehydrogenase [Corynebacterium sp. 142RC1]MCQ9362176.1 NAD-dependent succ